MEQEHHPVEPALVHAWLDSLGEEAKDRLRAGGDPLTSCSGCGKREACGPFIEALQGVATHGDAWFSMLDGVEWQVSDSAPTVPSS